MGADNLCDQCAGSGALVFPVGLQDSDGLVVSAETVDSGFDENEAELGVLVLSIALEMLADSDSLRDGSAVKKMEIWNGDMTYLLDQHVEIFWDFGCKT